MHQNMHAPEHANVIYGEMWSTGGGNVPSGQLYISQAKTNIRHKNVQMEHRRDKANQIRLQIL